MSEVGIENLKALSDFVMNLANGVSKSMADGKISLSDIFHFKSAAFSALPAFRGIKHVSAEYFDMDDQEKEDMKRHIAEKLQLDSKHAKVEEISESVMSMVVDLNELIMQLMDLKNAKDNS